jgi:antitoxin (DNA-binding transcriptional repressor) of toxin-antitoxin stability system
MSKQVPSDVVRREIRALLDDVQHRGEHVTILRYTTPAAVLVPVGWYEQAQAALSRTGDVPEGDPDR